MKNVFGILLFCICLFVSADLNAQCSDDTHTNNAEDAWQSCTKTPCPNAVRGTQHWQQYDLGYVYQFKDIRLWNYNVVGETNKGFRQIAIDYSLDGMTWTQGATFELPQATANPNYTGHVSNALSGIQARYVLITALNTWGNSCAGLSEARFEVEGVSLAVKAMLQGAYQSSDAMMRNDLGKNGLLPTQEPYTAQAYLHVGQGGGEKVKGGVLNVQGNAAVTDWVVLELRDAVDASIIIASRSCLVLRDGRIVDVDGISDVVFSGVAAGDYYVVVQHRNHLAVMTNAAISLTN